MSGLKIANVVWSEQPPVKIGENHCNFQSCQDLNLEEPCVTAQ